MDDIPRGSHLRNVGEEEDDFPRRLWNLVILTVLISSVIMEGSRNLPPLSIREEESALNPSNEDVDEEGILQKTKESHTIISRLSTHPFKYASWLSAQFFWKKSQGSYLIVWTCHVESFVASAWIFYSWHSMAVCYRFTETSQMIVAIHHTFVQVPFEHQSKAIGRDVEDNVVYNFKAFESGSTFKIKKCLHKLDFIIDWWFFFNSHHFHNFINVFQHNNTTFFLFASLIFRKPFISYGSMEIYKVRTNYSSSKCVLK